MLAMIVQTDPPGRRCGGGGGGNGNDGGMNVCALHDSVAKPVPRVSALAASLRVGTQRQD
jgi:hypothetical protein